ncbi:hypothetical protein AAB984_39615, partial [Burkholderia contaminans]|uniref:hypothetical protein n=1 Tax=Burkholderia contaminans TaxID=488447 RepID=UPI0031158331
MPSDKNSLVLHGDNGATLRCDGPARRQQTASGCMNQAATTLTRADLPTSTPVAPDMTELSSSPHVR